MLQLKISCTMTKTWPTKQINIFKNNNKFKNTDHRFENIKSYVQVLALLLTSCVCVCVWERERERERQRQRQRDRETERDWESFLIIIAPVWLGLPWWLSGKESACQCRRPMRPWVQFLSWGDHLEKTWHLHSVRLCSRHLTLIPTISLLGAGHESLSTDVEAEAQRMSPAQIYVVSRWKGQEANLALWLWDLNQSQFILPIR